MTCEKHIIWAIWPFLSITMESACQSHYISQPLTIARCEGIQSGYSYSTCIWPVYSPCGIMRWMCLWYKRVIIVQWKRRVNYIHWNYNYNHIICIPINPALQRQLHDLWVAWGNWLLSQFVSHMRIQIMKEDIVIKHIVHAWANSNKVKGLWVTTGCPYTSAAAR